jgi:hypothetical protein
MTIKEEIQENKILFEEMGKKVNDFTALLNKYNLDYQVQSWESLNGFDIFIDKIRIVIHKEGGISFESKEEKSK